MAFNLTGVDQGLFFTVNTAVNLGLFTIVALPTIIISVICILALFFAEDINWSMRVLIINILTSEVCLWVALAIRFLGYPLTARGLDGALISCRVIISLSIIGTMQKFFSIALYAVMVYIFIHYGVKKLKWKTIIPCIVISWMLSIFAGMMPYFDAFGIFESGGFCDVVPEFLLFRMSVVTVSVTAIISLSVILVFSTMTYIYIKRNTLESNVEIKKAIAKNLAYLNFVVFFSIITNITPATFPFIRAAFAERGFLSLIVTNYILRVFLNLPSLLTPIAAIITLKPIRLAMELAINKCCCRQD